MRVRKIQISANLGLAAKKLSSQGCGEFIDAANSRILHTVKDRDPTIFFIQHAVNLIMTPQEDGADPYGEIARSPHLVLILHAVN